MHRRLATALLALAGGLSAQLSVDFMTGDRVVFVGNTFAERQQLFSNFETMLTLAQADKQLRFRNLGWSADTLSLKPRPRDFGDEDQHLHAQKADVIFACYGMNEAFEGEAGLKKFISDWRRFIFKVKSATYNHDRGEAVTISGERVFPGIDDGREGDRPVRLVMVSPIAHEDLGGKLPDPTKHNEQLERYTAAMRRLSTDHDVAFVDLFHPTAKWMAEHPKAKLTTNGIHLNAFGDWVVARMMMAGLGFEAGDGAAASEAAALRDAIVAKNELWFYRWRAINGFYIYGGRKKPCGVVNFPGEMAELEQLIRRSEVAIDELARPLAAGYHVVPQPEEAR